MHGGYFPQMRQYNILRCDTQTMLHLQAPVLVHKSYYGLAFMPMFPKT